MRLTEAELKRIYQQETSRDAHSEQSCITTELLEKLAQDDVSAVDRAHAAAHLSSCSDCAREYRVLRALKPWAVETVPAAGRPSHSSINSIAHWLRNWWQQLIWLPHWRAAAMAVLLIAAGISFSFWYAAQSRDRYDTNERGRVIKLKVEPPDHAVIADVPGQLSWSPVDGADSYQVNIFDYESTPIWQSAVVKISSVAIPEEIRKKLPRGKTIYWRVTIISDIEKRQSEVLQFIVKA